MGRVPALEFLTTDIDLFLWVPCDLVRLTGIASLLRWLVFLGSLHPVKQGFLNEHLTAI
jgi:hypothetical protein